MVQFRFVSNLSKTFKSGEKVTLAGRYACLTCRYGGTRTEVDLAPGTIFPMCKADPVMDATWQLVRVLSATSAARA